MRNYDKLEQTQEALTNLITENHLYFKNKDAEEIARDFIECFMNDKPLRYAATPPAWLSDEVDRLLQVYEVNF